MSTEATKPATTQGGSPGAPAEIETAHRHLGLALALICIAQLMVVLDATIANIALPYIQADLDFTQSALPWIVTGYSLTFGGFLLLGGRCGDLFGRRRMFILGLVVFAVASLVGGFAESEAMLLASRAAQGLGAAFASPNALALITTTFPPGPRRSRAFAVYAMMSGIGAAVGLLLGGWLTGSDPTIFGIHIAGWRLTFLINVPIGLLAAFAAPKLLGESDTHAGDLDVPGAVTATAGLLSLVYGITRAGDRSYGWGDPWTLTAMGVGVVLLVIFVLLERREPQPLLPGRILADRNRMAAYVVMMLIPAGMFTMFFFLTLVLQNVMGETPMRTGLMFLPFSIVMILSAGVASRLVQRVNPGLLAGAGAIIGSIGVFGFSRIPYDDGLPTLATPISYATDILPWIVVMGIGMPMVFIPMTMSVVHGVSHRDSGIASGVLNTMQQVGGALGLATFSTIAFDAAANKAVELCTGLRLDQAACQGSQVGPVAFTHGASIGFMCCAAMMFVGGVVAASLNRIRHEDLSGVGPAAVAAH